MSAASADPIVSAALRRMAAAAAYYDRALAELLPAMRALERHPDFAFTERQATAGARSADSLTLAWWIHNCCLSGLRDGGEDAGAWLREDAAGGAERSLAQWIETEEQDLRRFARTRRGRREVRPRPGRPRAIAQQAGQAMEAGILRAGHGPGAR